MPSKRKSSVRVTLVLVGVAALAGCQRQPESKRDVYASKEDCLADWGHKAEDCTPATDRPRQGGGGGFFFYGPMYAAAAMNAMRSSAWSGSGARPGSHAVDSAPASSSNVSRGGFGGTGRASSSGG